MAVFSALSAASTNLTSVKAGPVTLTGWSITNSSTSTRYVRIYNKASPPVPASDAALIVMRFPFPAGMKAEAQLRMNAPWLSAGLAFDITGGAADTDATVTAVGDVSINLFTR